MKATVFGGFGLLGHEIICERPQQTEIYAPTSYGLNLELHQAISSNNDIWINCAAKVGGVKANTDHVADFYNCNSLISNNVFQGAKKCNVKKLVSILSTCIYPDVAHVSYPLTEDQLHNGPPHDSNFGYAYAKRMVDVQSRAYRQQYNCDYITVIPNNLYGFQDNFDLNSGHVIPSLIRKFYEAKRDGTDVTLWGDGTPLREFTFARDAAKIIWWLAKNYNDLTPVNIGCTEEISIKDLAFLISEKIGFKGNIKFDATKPNGQHRKPSSNKKLRDLGCNIVYTPLTQGLIETIEFFEKNYSSLRGIK
jgi:GDP-L-fucose synthase